MADQEVIKSFLVSLGFKSDEVSQKKFANSIAWATGRVQLFMRALEKAGKVVYDVGKRFVQGMENLFYVAQRTDASVEGIEAFSFAVQHLGGSAEGALGSLEGIGSFMRNTPGAEGFIRALGVQTRDVNGNLRDTAELMIDIGKRLSKMDHAHANAYAGVLGIDERTLIAMRSGEFERHFRKHQEMARAVDMEKASKQARDFSNKVRDVGAQFSILGVQIQSALFEKFAPKLDQLIAWLQANGPAIAERITRIVQRLLDFADKLAPLFSMIGGMIAKLDSVTNGWSTTVLGLAAAFKLLGGSITGMIGGTLQLGAAMGRLGAVGGAAVGGYQVGSLIYDKIDDTAFAEKLGAGIARTLAFFGNDEAQASIERMNAPNVPSGRSGSNAVTQKTDIHVYGTDAQSAGASVAREQDRVNQRLVRNFKGAVQ